MPLLPLAAVRPLNPLLMPWRRLAARAWLREADCDYWLQRLHPLLSLNRVYARLLARRWVSDDMLALTLQCNGNVCDWRPGQHVQLFREVDGVRLSRCYSLTAVDGHGRIELAIKRQAGGRLSGLLQDHLGIGERVELSQASGSLRWPSQAQGVLLLAAGSGITPLLGLLRQALASGYSAPVTLLHYVRERGQRAFAEELQALMQRHANLQVRWSLTGQAAQGDELSGRFCPAHVPERAAEQALACGPHGFVAAVQRWWQGGETPASLQSEAFSPAPVDAGEQTCVRLAFRRSGVACQGDTAHNLLEQAEAQGLRPMHGCRQGICTRCTCQLLSGRVRDLRSGLVSDEPGQAVRLCVSVPLGDVEIDL